jgi:tetratricopeptide (TPR) repeat protein
VRRLGAAALLLWALGCTPQSQLIAAVAPYMVNFIPLETMATVMSNLKGVDNKNQKRLDELAAQGDWDGVARFAEDNIAKDRRIADWWVVAGLAYAQMGQYAKASERFAEAVRLEPGEMEHRNLLALSQRLEGHPQRALKTLNEALRVNQETSDTYYLIGECLMDLKQPDRAVDAYERVLALEPQSAEALFGLGLAYAELGRTSEYRQVAERLRQMEPALADRLAAASRR